MPDLPPDDQRFLDAYTAASGGEAQSNPRPRQGSLASAVPRYLASDSFAALSNETRSSRRRMLDEIRRNHGTGLVRDLRTKHVEAALSKFSGHARNNRLKVWRAFGKWLEDVYKIEDPAQNVKKSPVPKSDGHVPWSKKEVKKFREFWPIGTSERLAFEVIFFTGARISDAFRLGQGNVDQEGWLVFNQQKTGGEVAIPFSRPLPDFASGMQSDLQYLRAALDARSDKHITWITTAFGTSRSVKAAGQWFAAKARAAGIHGRTAHGLRKSRSQALAEAGGNSVQIGAWTGHESLSEIERYIRGLNKRKVLSGTETEQKVPTSATKVPTQPKKTGESNA
ncbi:tyrosine-type recombinase/integrase [Gymnodinialimonas ulvae]|uniref:tyrosine-type recombinase/integrase n=1 Tax=Gymnodinialimonas ulvae TaxID=3126504 RepID=UPI0030B05183